MSRSDVLAHRITQITAKVKTGRPTTAEDVHMAAVAWAIAAQKREAAAGTTTGADLHLLRSIRAQGGAGDAAAQAICDAATTWRQATRLDPDAGRFRWLLAQTVDHHHGRGGRRRRLVRGAAAATVVTGIGLAGDIIMTIEHFPEGQARGIPILVTLVGFLTTMGLLWRIGRGDTR